MGEQMRDFMFFSSLIVLSVVPLYFVVHHIYKDGLIGRVALLGISFCSLLMTLDALFSDGDTQKYYPQPLVISLIALFAVFLVWHLVRFHSRVLKRNQLCPPDCPVDRRKPADRRFKK